MLFVCPLFNFCSENTLFYKKNKELIKYATFSSFVFVVLDGPGYLSFSVHNGSFSTL